MIVANGHIRDVCPKGSGAFLWDHGATIYKLNGLQIYWQLKFSAGKMMLFAYSSTVAGAVKARSPTDIAALALR